MHWLILLSSLLSNQVIYATTNSLSFSVDGKRLKEQNIQSLKKQFRIIDVAVYSVATHRMQHFKAFKLTEILNSVYGPKWLQATKLSLQCYNKYQPDIPIEQLKKRDAYLAFKFSNGDKFQFIDKTSHNLVSLAPFYLIWDSHCSLSASEKRQYRSAYQLIAINLITHGQHISNIGELSYNRYCLRCHALNNQGGTVGPKFTASNIVQKKGKKYVYRYILYPEKMQKFTKMPAFKYLKGRAANQKAALAIVNYLQTAAKIDYQKKKRSKFSTTKELSKLIDVQ